MKDDETKYLNKLFSTGTHSPEELENDFPLVDVPPSLSDKLYAIAETPAIKPPSLMQRFFRPGPVLSGVAASLLATVMVIQAYQQYQTMQQLEQAQADLATALGYLQEANQIARAQVLSTLNSNLKKAGVESALEAGQESVIPPLRELEEESTPQNRRL